MQRNSTDQDRRLSGAHNDLGTLKWITVLLPVLFLVLLELLQEALLPDFFSSWPGYLLLTGLVLLATLTFAELVFSVIERVQNQLQEQNRELLTLHEAGLIISSELELDLLLQRVVDLARDLVGCQYGALALKSSQGGVDMFLTSGISSEQRSQMGPDPESHGLLDYVITEGKPLRLGEITSHPRSVGFPEEHPEMHTLLAVPIRIGERVLGGLYLAEKANGAEFDEADQTKLERFAVQAALAIENARLHRQVRVLAVADERERIAREMHDSLAQVLGYVNTKAQAIQELLRAGKVERAEEHLGQLSGAAREAYVDVRENILGLRITVEGSRTFAEILDDYFERWQDQSDIQVEFDTSTPAPAITSEAELQLLRIIQEALSNVRKHAHARRATITMRERDGLLVTTIEDDGTGFDPELLGRGDFPRFGLTIMQERAESVGGRFEIGPGTGGGTRIEVELPLSKTRSTARSMTT